MEYALVIAREMTMAFDDRGGMFLYFPYELLLIILAKLPIRYLVRIKAVSKRWNQILSSLDAFKLIHRNISLVFTPTFFIHSSDRGEKVEQLPSWVIEPTTREFYKFPIPKFPRLLFGNIIVDGCNGIYCLFHGLTIFSKRDAFTICNPGNNTFKRLPENKIVFWNFSAIAFDPSTAHFTLLLGLDENTSSSSNSSEEENESDT
ncbi:hypothetical protein KI387_023879, partial [Taxus chinensis]